MGFFFLNVAVYLGVASFQLFKMYKSVAYFKANPDDMTRHEVGQQLFSSFQWGARGLHAPYVPPHPELNYEIGI